MMFKLASFLCFASKHKTFKIHNVKNITTNAARILGIETSCDDTGCAIVDTSGNILGESLFSQQCLHTELGGIIPPIACDLHKNNIEKVVNETLQSSSLKLNEVDAIAVTVQPGLPLSLLVGLNYAKQLSTIAKKPLIPIHHMEAHALTIRLIEKVETPFLVLLISGGHCLIAIAEDVDKFLLLGRSHDDAPGEALDKIARRLKLTNLPGLSGMSGGRAIEILAKEGDPEAIPIAEPLLHSKDCCFSFAGIKNSSRYYILTEEEKHKIEGDLVLPNVADFCASVQFAISKHLCRRIQRAITFCQEKSLIPPSRQNLVVSGGVASNQQIRRSLEAVASTFNYQLLAPPPHLCTDNGVMIAWNGVEKWNRGIGIVPHTDIDSVDIKGKAPFGHDISEEVILSNVKCSKWVSLKNIFSKPEERKMVQNVKSQV